MDPLAFLSVRFHCGGEFFIPGMDLGEGLRWLYDDHACLAMPQHINDGGVTDIYVEAVVVEKDEHDEIEVEVPVSMSVVVTNPEKGIDKDLLSFRNFYKSPSKSPKSVPGDRGKQVMVEPAMEGKGSNSDSSYADYQAKDINSSGDDEEVEQLRQYAKQIKRDIRAKKSGHDT